MDYSVIPVYLVLALIIFGIIFRKELRAWRIRQKLKAAGIPAGTAEPPLLSTRLYELDKIFGPFGSDAAHPSALYAHKQFIEAVGLLGIAERPLAVVLQYVEGNSWSLSSAAIAALRKRSDRGEARRPRAGAMRALFAVGDVFRAGFPRRCRAARCGRRAADPRQGLVGRQPLDAEHVPRLFRSLRGAGRRSDVRPDACCSPGCRRTTRSENFCSRSRIRSWRRSSASLMRYAACRRRRLRRPSLTRH